MRFTTVLQPAKAFMTSAEEAEAGLLRHCHRHSLDFLEGAHGRFDRQQPHRHQLRDHCCRAPLQTCSLQIQNATTTIRAEDGTLLASFAAGSIGLEQDITVRSDRTLNATTADFAQLIFVGSTAATGPSQAAAP